MDQLTEKFSRLGIDSAPGQEGRQQEAELPLRGGPLLDGVPIDFSHGDVDAFPPPPGVLETFTEGFRMGGKQAYTEYRGRAALREDLAEKLSAFTGAPIDPDREIILTPGTQGALFLALGAVVGRGDQVVIVEPDYFANRKLVEFFDGVLCPVQLDYERHRPGAGLDPAQLEERFREGAKVFLFSNPNNPTGAVYSYEEVAAIGRLAKQYGVTVVADELYSRQIFSGTPAYTHLRSMPERPEHMLTIIGPSKTESLSGFRLGAAFGSADLILRMEKLQAIVTLRAAGYNQSVFRDWFREPEGWMTERIARHQAIRDDILALIRACPGCSARTTDGGSYLFWKLPELEVTLGQFVQILRKHAAVTVTPGTEFGPRYTDCVRLNFSQDRAAAVEAVKRVITMIERYRTV